MGKEYTGSWSANNGSTYNHGYTDTNKSRLAKDMRTICKGNVFAGNTGNWQVCDDDNNVILQGTCR